MFHRESIILLNFICPNSSKDRAMGYEPVDESSNLSWDANSIKIFVVFRELGYALVPIFAGMMKLANMMASNTIASACGFKSHFPQQIKNLSLIF